MVKNTTGGSKHKKQKNSSVKVERALVTIEDENESYGQVTTFLGGNMVMVRKLGTNIEFRCRLKKSLPRIYKKDYVLYAIREFGVKDIGDVILVYTPDEIHILKKEKHIDEELEEDDIFDLDAENENQEKEEDVNIENI
jgi:translation initiation factor IF-1